ncbi:probable methyltransferase PMT2 [Tanacetum coccineum]
MSNVHLVTSIAQTYGSIGAKIEDLTEDKLKVVPDPATWSLLEENTFTEIMDKEVKRGIASWGAYLWKRNVIAMSFARRDNHEAQVQFALEREVLVVTGVLGSIKMPYPSKAFDIYLDEFFVLFLVAGKYMMEVDWVFRHGGYWVLSGPPISCNINYKSWEHTTDDLEE